MLITPELGILWALLAVPGSRSTLPINPFKGINREGPSLLIPLKGIKREVKKQKVLFINFLNSHFSPFLVVSAGFGGGRKLGEAYRHCSSELGILDSSNGFCVKFWYRKWFQRFRL